MRNGGMTMKLFLAICAAVLAAGCASVPMQKAENDTIMVCDYERMARLERAAIQERAQLHWVNCPLIRRDRLKAGS